MSTKIYIAGKVSGLPRAQCSMKFGAYEQKLMQQGFEPIVPLNIVDKDDDWNTAMAKCIDALLKCEEIHFLPCWKDSPGAKLEHAIAHQFSIKIKFV